MCEPGVPGGFPWNLECQLTEALVGGPLADICTEESGICNVIFGRTGLGGGGGGG